MQLDYALSHCALWSQEEAVCILPNLLLHLISEQTVESGGNLKELRIRFKMFTIKIHFTKTNILF